MFKTQLSIAALAAVTLASAGAAAAATPVITILPSGLAAPAGQQMIADFDNPTASGFAWNDVSGAYARSGSLGLDPGVSAPPPGDVSNYETVLGSGQAELTSTRLLRSLSFYMGSPNSYNSVEFIGPSYDVKLDGSDLFSPPTAFNGDQSVGLRVNYDFGGALVNEVIFTSSGNSFEFDNLAGAVPEPGAWAMMILGMTALGALLRGQRGRIAAAA